MDIALSQRQDIDVIALSGRLDGLSGPELEQRVDERLAAGAARMIVDCSELEYASSAGLRAFLTSAKKTETAGGRLVFCSLQANVADLFEISGLDQLFSIHGDADAAAAALTS